MLKQVVAGLIVLVLSAAAWAQGNDDARKCFESAMSHKKIDAALAIHSCTQAINSGQLSDEALAASFHNRGLAYGRGREHDLAIQDFDQAVRLNPNHADAFADRGGAYGDRREYNRAIQDFDGAIQLNPNHAGAFFGRAVGYVNKGNYDRAMQDYDRAIRLNPNHAGALRNRGRLSFDQGRFAGAVTEGANCGGGHAAPRRTERVPV